MDSSKNISHRLIWPVLAIFILLSFSASVVNPLHEATDELRHYRFVQHIIQKQALPVQGAVGCSAQGHHPPLFYSLAALATFWINTERDVCYEPEINPFWNYRQWEVGVDNKNLYLHPPDEAFPWTGMALAAHITRGVNVLLGAATIYLTWLIGAALWPKRPLLALGSAAFIAFNPMFVYMAGAINNDVIAALMGTAVLLACIKLAQDEAGLSRRWGIILGGLFGLSLLSKFNLLAVGGILAAAVTWVAWRKKQWRLWFEVALIGAGMTLLLSGWWFWRNQLLYGEPTGVQRLTELWGVRDPAESWGVAIFELKPTWTSLWGRFGYGQIPLPPWIYTVMRWLIGAGFAGLLIPLIRQNKADKQLGIPLALLLLNVGLFFGVVFNYLLISPAGAMGRFFFPALSSLSILTFYGLAQWVELLTPFTTLTPNPAVKKLPISNPQPTFSRPPAKFTILTLIVYLTMMSLTAVAIFGYLAPAYAQPAQFDDHTAVPNPTNAQFDALVNLRGYEIKQTVVQPGQPLDLDLYWEVTAQPPGNYLLFVHLFDDETNSMIVQRDTHPGLGNSPTRYWQTGQQFVESIRLWLPETAYAPSTATVSIGLYAPGSYRLGIAAADGTGLGDSLTLGQIAIEPAASLVLDQPIANPLDQNFNNEIRLIGYDYSQRVLSPGSELTVTLNWQLLQDDLPDYELQLLLLNEAGGVETAVKIPFTLPNWQNRQIVTTMNTFSLSPEMAPGPYRIHVALIDSSTNAPQNIVAEDGHWINNHLLLSIFRLK